MQILGYQPQDLLGKTVYDFYHSEDRDHMKETFDQGKEKLLPSDYFFVWVMRSLVLNSVINYNAVQWYLINT